jgi:hypothetical protein
MARQVALSSDTAITGRLSLITQLRNLCNIQNSTFFSTAELTEIINQELPQVHEHLVGSYGDKYFYKEQTFNLVAAQQLYPLATDYGWLWRVQVQYQVNSGYQWVDVPRIDSVKLNLINNYPVNFPSQLKTPLQYEPRGSDPAAQSAGGSTVGVTNLFFVPYQYIGTQPIKVAYAPCCPVLIAATDTYDFIDGWENALIYGAAAKVMIKKSRDPSGFYQLQADQLARIDAMAERDAGYAEQEHDFEGQRYGNSGIY